MNEDLQQALRYDGLADAERLTGKSYKEDESLVWLGMALMQKQNETKNALLFLNRDTISNRQTIPEFFEILADMGFREILKLAIEGTQDHFHVFWKSGLLITLDTFHGSINGGTCYFNFRGPRNAIHGSNGWVKNTERGPVWKGDTDIREGLRHKLDTMSEVGELLETWVSKPFLWLLHYRDTKTEGYDHESITSERIAMLPEYVRKAIAGEETP